MNIIETSRKKPAKIVVLCFRLILGVIFLAAAFGKLVDIERYSVNAVYFFGLLLMSDIGKPWGIFCRRHGEKD